MHHNNTNRDADVNMSSESSQLQWRAALKIREAFLPFPLWLTCSLWLSAGSSAASRSITLVLLLSSDPLLLSCGDVCLPSSRDKCLFFLTWERCGDRLDFSQLDAKCYWCQLLQNVCSSQTWQMLQQGHSLIITVISIHWQFILNHLRSTSHHKTSEQQMCMYEIHKDKRTSRTELRHTSWINNQSRLQQLQLIIIFALIWHNYNFW